MEDRLPLPQGNSAVRAAMTEALQEAKGCMDEIRRIQSSAEDSRDGLTPAVLGEIQNAHKRWSDKMDQYHKLAASLI